MFHTTRAQIGSRSIANFAKLTIGMSTIALLLNEIQQAWVNHFHQAKRVMMAGLAQILTDLQATTGWTSSSGRWGQENFASKILTNAVGRWVYEKLTMQWSKLLRRCASMAKSLSSEIKCPLWKPSCAEITRKSLRCKDKPLTRDLVAHWRKGQDLARRVEGRLRSTA